MLGAGYLRDFGFPTPEIRIIENGIDQIKCPQCHAMVFLHPVARVFRKFRLKDRITHHDSSDRPVSFFPWVSQSTSRFRLTLPRSEKHMQCICPCFTEYRRSGFRSTGVWSIGGCISTSPIGVSHVGTRNSPMGMENWPFVRRWNDHPSGPPGAGCFPRFPAALERR